MDGRSRADHPDLRGGTLRLTALLLLLPVAVAAQDRTSRSYDARDGLSAPTVFSLAQDSTGFVWIGTVGGLYRHDGVEIQPWAPGTIRGRVRSVAVLADGRVAALEAPGRLWWIEDLGASPVEGPDGAPLDDVLDVARGADGAAWILLRNGRIWRRGADGAWTPVAEGAFEGERARRIFPGSSGGVDVATGGGLWTLAPGGATRRLASVSRVVAVRPAPAGGRYVLTFWREAFLLDGGGLRKIADAPGRGIDLALRDGVLWIAYDRYLARVAPGEETVVLGREDGIEDAGPLLVDREGSLWIGTFTGLRQLPEPETVRWTDAHGLPSAHTRFLARTGDTVWVSTWQGTGRVERRDGAWVADTARIWLTRAALSADDEGDLWVGSSRGLVEIRSGRPPRVVDPDVGIVRAFAPGPGDELWLGIDGGLLRARTDGHGGGARLDTIRGLDLQGGESVEAVYRDGAGRVWTGIGNRICVADAASALSGGRPGWECRTVPGAVHFNAFHETPAGAIWAASPYAGVLRLHEGGWEAVPGVDGLPSRSVLNLVPSPSGGVWVLGHGFVLRVRPDPDAPAGWQVLERLTPWHGLSAPGGRDLLEDPDGTVWVATSRGVVRIPAPVRGAAPSPPPVSVVEARVDDERLALNGTPELPHDRNRLELRFAALSYRAPSAVRYQVRLVPGRDWSDAGLRPVVRWVDLNPGKHRVEVRASVDGETWSDPVASFDFVVLPPWYLEPRWILASCLVLALLALLGYRARVAHLVGLERQRTRIAMDLHDEMGAALGSIGIQAGMLARPDVAVSQRRRLAGEIAETAEELGTTLADIVWSLDPRAATLRGLALRLEERGRRLFADGGTELDFRLPSAWPDRELSPPVRRNVLMIGLEALKNAASHADAGSVVVSLAPRRGSEWRLWVRDDGRGASPGDLEEGDGLGVLSMQKRADEMEADLTWRPAANGGTVVALTFRPEGERPWWKRMAAAWARAKARMNVLMRRG